MWNHDAVWSAIDALARRHGLTPSGLARKAGLDSTSFNPSKRHASDGRPRWPSTESIHKVLAATGESLADFVGAAPARASPGKPGTKPSASVWRIAEGHLPARRPVPLLGFAQAGAGGFFDDGGFPAGQGWDEVPLPGLEDEGAYALEVSGESMLPLYRDGDIIIVSPASQVRPGDRVVVKTSAGEVMAKTLKRRRADRLELSSLNPDHPERVVPIADIAWVARILWASQ